MYHAGLGLAFYARPHALGLDPVAPVPLSPVQRIVGPPNQRLGTIICAADRDAEAPGHAAARIIDLLRDDAAQPLGHQMCLSAIGLRRDDQELLPAPAPITSCTRVVA